MRNKLPQYLINAIKRRARAAELWNLADEQIAEYCKKLGLDTEFVNGHVHTVVETNPEFFIQDLEKCLERAHAKTSVAE